MNKENTITLRELANKFRLSHTTIYNYIQKGFLPRPKRIPNKEKGRGTLAVYLPDIVKKVEEIQRRLKKTHSLEQIKKDLKISQEEKKDFIVMQLKELTRLAKQGKYDSEKFENDIQAVSDLVNATASTGTSYIIKTSSVKEK